MTMGYRPLGGTGMHVSAHCLGTMMFGEIGNPDHDECVRIVHAALDHGINFVDTADMYSDGESEQIVGKALHGRRDDVVLATKAHFPMGDEVNHRGNSRRWLVTELENSLRRLDTDWIDLYQIHRPDEDTDIEETLSALTDLRQAGKIRAFGCSTFPAEQIVESHRVASQGGLGRFRTEQPPYNMLARGIEANVLPVCARYGMGVLVWSPLAWGFLSGKYRRDQPVDMGSGRAALRPAMFDPAAAGNAARYEAVERLVEVAAGIGCSLPELALAFPVTHPAVTSAIIGPRTMAQFESAVKAATLELDDDTLDRIDEIVPPGTNVYDPNATFPPAVLTDPDRRRRPATTRAAAN
jgi:aryl-alcohol dehydrogenase-like predicted oxidoreductase